MLYTEDDKRREDELDLSLLDTEGVDIHLDTDFLLEEPIETRRSEESDALLEAAKSPARDETRDDFGFGDLDIAAPVETPVMEEAAPVETKTEQPVQAQQASHEIRTGFSWTSFAGCLAAIGWLAAAIGVPVQFYGIDQLANLHPALQAGLLALALGPTILIWLGAAAVGEAARAGKLAYALTKIAREAVLPTDEETQAHNLTHSVRSEIERLNAALDEARTRLESLEGQTARQAQAFSKTISTAVDGASVFLETMSRERAAFVDLNEELKGQTEIMAQNVSRQVRLMRETSKLVKSELGDAQDTLRSHLETLSDSTSSVADRTRQLNDAAANAVEASGRLDETVGGALDSLVEATKLTDAARKSTETAVHAANVTANAVRDTTQRAIHDAKRAAELIRAETHAFQEAAAGTLATLKAAADAAREASEEAQAAADKHAASIEKRLSALAGTATVMRKRDGSGEKVVEAAHTVETKVAASAGARSRTVRSSQKGVSGWNGGLMGKPANDEAPRAEEKPRQEPARQPESSMVERICGLIADAGVLLEETLTTKDLDAIATASRQGSAARRRAVLDAAPIATTRIARYVRRDQESRDLAAAFRARPDLAKAGRGDTIRAYLLVDAALG
ncbi:MAG: hypothetical protein JNJ73_18475 [Hyphomonadaceae bacterium]|nr:hypothetical protein [Hyphomonadaceae bacterium]